MESIMFFKLLLALPLLHWCVMGKECTNIPTKLSSHTFRFDLLSSNNDTLKQEMFSHYHLTPTDDSAWASLLPRNVLKEEDELDWLMLYRKMKNLGGDKIAKGFLNEVSLHDVKLEPGSIHWQAQQTNLEYLLMLNVDSLVWSFRKNAGLQAPGKPYGGWEAPDGELRGHFVGHYLSATAQMWASTRNTSLKANMDRVVRALATCQDKIGTGYLSAFPSEQFDRFEAIQPVWAPYYTIHKIMAGLLDQYIFANDNGALRMTERMADYFYKRVKNMISKHTIERHWLSINEETGGMNDILYRLYNIKGNMKHLWLAHLFDKPCFLGELALKADDISGFHANSHIPIIIGSQMRYEVTGDPLYKEIGTFFMNIVNSSHTYATGGTSVSEFWSDPKRLATTLQTENEESCTTYNMLKVSRNLFRWTKEMAYADYYERALTNGVLSIQRGRDPGVMIYMLPLGRGESKERSYHGWGTQFDSFWCCYGTGIESFSKLGDSIYFEEWEKVPVLYVIQYISSSLNWIAGRVSINQKVEPVVSTEHHLGVTVIISLKEQEAHQIFTLKFRIPFWAHSKGLKAVLNRNRLSLPASGNFLTVTRKWSTGDKLTLELPLSLRTESIQDDRPGFDSLQAILYGPYLLVGLTNDDWDLQAESDSLSDWISPIPSSHNSHLISLTQEHGHITFALFNSNNSIKMDKLPEPGTNSSVHATFRLIMEGSKLSEHSGLKGDIGRSVMLEPFDLPGMFVVHEGRGGSLRVTDFSREKNSVFSLAAGLNGKDDTVSLESEKHKGCFVHSENKHKLGVGIKLKCNAELSDDRFKEAASFRIRDGVSTYGPISFVAKGVRRNFVLAPLYSLRDEYYTVYFKIHP